MKKKKLIKNERNRKVVEDDFTEFIQFWVATVEGRFHFRFEVVHHAAEFGDLG